MVQIIQERTFGSDFGKALGAGLEKGMESGFKDYDDKKKKLADLSKENDDIFKATGIKLSGTTPAVRKLEFADKLKLKQKEQETADQLTENRQTIRGIESQRGLAEGTLSNFENDPSLAEKITKPEKTKSPIGGLAGIPPTEEESKAISKVIQENPDATAEQLELKFQEEKIPPARYRDLLESRRRTEVSKHEEQAAAKREKRKEDINFHNETQKYDEELLKAKKSAQTQLNAIKDVEKAITTGKVRPSSLANIFKSFGDVGKKISNAILSGEEATIQASIPAFLEGRKELFGVRLSDADLKLLEDKMPDISKSPEANAAIIKIMKKYSELSLLRAEIGERIKEENGGLRPLGYPGKIEKRYDEMTAPIAIVTPYGKVIEVPAYKVGDFIKDGSSLYEAPSE